MYGISKPDCLAAYKLIYTQEFGPTERKELGGNFCLSHWGRPTPIRSSHGRESVNLKDKLWPSILVSFLSSPLPLLRPLAIFHPLKSLRTLRVGDGWSREKMTAYQVVNQKFLSVDSIFRRATCFDSKNYLDTVSLSCHSAQITVAEALHWVVIPTSILTLPQGDF